MYVTAITTYWCVCHALLCNVVPFCLLDKMFFCRYRCDRQIFPHYCWQCVHPHGHLSYDAEGYIAWCKCGYNHQLDKETVFVTDVCSPVMAFSYSIIILLATLTHYDNFLILFVLFLMRLMQKVVQILGLFSLLETLSQNYDCSLRWRCNTICTLYALPRLARQTFKSKHVGSKYTLLASC